MSVNGYTADGQDPKIVQRVLGKLRAYLGEEERIHYVSVQRRRGLSLFPDSVVVTGDHLYLLEFNKLRLDLIVEVLPWPMIRSITKDIRRHTSDLKILTATDTDFVIEHLPTQQVKRLMEYVAVFLEDEEALEGVIVEESSMVKALSGPRARPAPAAKPAAAAKPVPAPPTKPTAQPAPVTKPATNASSKPAQEPKAQQVHQTQQAPAKLTPELDPRIQRLQSLYRRQLITKAEFETKTKQYQLEK